MNLKAVIRAVYMQGATTALGEMHMVGDEMDETLETVAEDFDKEWERTGRPGCSLALSEAIGLMGENEAHARLAGRAEYLAKAIREYLNEDFPEGTLHPADWAANRLGRALQRAEQ